MSLLDPTTGLDAVLPGLSVEQRDALIERAESYLAGLIGINPDNQVTTGGTPETETAEIVCCRGVTESAPGVPIDDPADPQYIPSPLGATTVTIDFYAPVTAKLLELPIGPLLTISDIIIGGTDTPVADFNFLPWTLRFRDNRKLFAAGVHIQLSGVVGWTRVSVPERIRECILLAIDIIRSKSAAGGALKSLSKTSEQLGPYRATFGEGGSASAALRAGDMESAETILNKMIGPWKLPTGYF